jgi:sulfite reductase alpha subunit-like flavoprotein
MGFLQHRKHLLLSGYNLGPAILVFGCRTKDEDFIYKSELEGYLKDGVISHLLVAFSREKGQEKVYVQHMVQRNGSLIASNIASEGGGGTLYVCGDAKFMAPSVRCPVDKALEPYSIKVTTLVEQQRYVEDCWAA